LRCSARRCARDDRGIAAVEFAMIAPLMIVMIFGMIDVTMGVGVDRKVTMMAQAMSDLASRAPSTSDTEITNFFNIGRAMIAPYPTTDLTSRITQIYLDPGANGTGKVQWSKGDAPLTAGSSVTVPAGLISKDSNNAVIANQYLILAEVNYVYKPIIGYVVAKTGVTLTESTFTRPRQSVCVMYSPATSCTTKTSP
jgi:Flp pilus assembly protein TadG